MAITLGTFSKLDDGVFAGTFKTLHVTAALNIVPVEKLSENAPDFRVYTARRHEVGAGWSQVAKSSGETYQSQDRPRARVDGPSVGPRPRH